LAQEAWWPCSQASLFVQFVTILLYSMVKLTVLALLLLSLKLTSGKRLQKSIKAEALEGSSWDVLACDTMCMQCPNGKNILIQRQKTTFAAVSSVVAGAFTLGAGFPVMNQLNGCSKIGFEFWQNRELLQDQPVQTDSWKGTQIWVKHSSGLEKMQEMVDSKTSQTDLQALEHCERLSDAYLWQAVRGAFSMTSAHNAQQDFARKCLAHSALCDLPLELGETMNASVELNVARFNPFAHEDMCSAPIHSAEMEDGSDPLPPRGPGHVTKTSGSSNKDKQMAGDGWQALQLEAGGDKVEGGAETPANEVEVDTEIPDKKSSSQDAAPQTTSDSEETEQTVTKEMLATDAELSANTVEEAGKLLEKLKRAQEAEEKLEPAQKSEEQLKHVQYTVVGGAPTIPQEAEEKLERAQKTEEQLKHAQSTAAGGALTTAQWGKDAVVRDFLIGGYCRTEDQLKICKKSGLTTSSLCKDRCCLDVCHFYENRPSCISGCVKHKKYDEAEYHRLMAVIG